jgi:hypothetical protein
MAKGKIDKGLDTPVKGYKIPALEPSNESKNPKMAKPRMPAVKAGGMFEHARPEGKAHGIGGVSLPELPVEHSSKHN